MNTYREFFGLSAWPFEEVSLKRSFSRRRRCRRAPAYLARRAGWL